MSTKLLGRILLFSGAVLLFLLITWEAFGEELTVAEVRRNIPMSEKDPVYKDFYITGGAAQGLKNHLVVNAVRKVALKDATGSQNVGEISVPVAQLRIIMVGDKVSVARLYKDTSREDEPMLEQTGVMIGDKVELKGSFVDNRKPTVKTSETEETAKAIVPTTVPAATPPPAIAAVPAATAAAKATIAKTAAATKPAEKAPAETEAPQVEAKTATLETNPPN